jgi:hypothetical protein
MSPVSAFCNKMNACGFGVGHLKYSTINESALLLVKNKSIFQGQLIPTYFAAEVLASN